MAYIFSFIHLSFSLSKWKYLQSLSLISSSYCNFKPECLEIMWQNSDTRLKNENEHLGAKGTGKDSGHFRQQSQDRKGLWPSQIADSTILSCSFSPLCETGFHMGTQALKHEASARLCIGAAWTVCICQLQAIIDARKSFVMFQQ